MEWYRDDLDEARSRDPFPKLKKELLDNDFSEDDLKKLKKRTNNQVKIDYEKALKAEDPNPKDLYTHQFAPTPITEEKGERKPSNKTPTSYGRFCPFCNKRINVKTSRIIALRTRCWKEIRRGI